MTAIITHVCDDCTAGNHRMCLDQGQVPFSCDDGWEGACECEHDDLAGEMDTRWTTLREEIQRYRDIHNERGNDLIDEGKGGADLAFARADELKIVLATMDRMEQP